MLFRMGHVAALLALTVIAGSLADLRSVGGEGPEVMTRYGKVRGRYVDNVAVYYGLPFASPPLGQLRWQPPALPKPWGGETPYNATFMRPSCPQTHCDLFSPPLVCPSQISEDCLYLDIFTPKDASVNTSIGYPVMVFVHGGNFVRMSGSTPLYDGRKLAGTRGVILVNINYRMGALGFLVTGEAESDARGNYGVLDQQAALQWVKNNIRDFGGDPSKVTLFGQSAGAQSVLLHYTLPSSSPFFRNAIVESSPIAIPYKRFPEAIVLGSLLTELLGCRPRDMNCLRSRSAMDIARAQYKTLSDVSSLKLLELFEPWGPFVDGELIKAEPLQVLRMGDFSPKPLIIGTVSEETVVYIYSAWNKSVSALRYEEVLFALYPAHFLHISARYPPSNSTSDERETMVRMSTDLVFACPTRNATRYIRSRGLSHVWLYIWDHAFSFPGWGHVTECEGRVCHGSELVYVFHSEWAGNYTFTHDEQVLSGLIMDFWTNFAKSGNPNFAESRNPDFAESGNPNFAESRNPDFAESGNPNFAASRNPDFAESGNPNFAESRNPDFAESGKANSNKSRNPNFAELAKTLSFAEPRNAKFVGSRNPSFVEPRNPYLAESRNPNFDEPGYRNYVRSRNPSLMDNGSRLVKSSRMNEKVVWPAYDKKGNWPNFRFKSPAGGVEVNYKGDNCDFWDTIGYAA